MGRLLPILLALLAASALSGCATPPDNGVDEETSSTESVGVQESQSGQATEGDSSKQTRQRELVIEIDLDRVVINGRTAATLVDGFLPPKAHHNKNPDSYLIPAVPETLDSEPHKARETELRLVVQSGPLVPAVTLGKVLYSSMQAKNGPESGASASIEIGHREPFEIVLPMVTAEPPKLTRSGEMKPLNAVVAIAEDGMRIAADAKVLAGPTTCPDKLTFCLSKETSLAASLKTLRQAGTNESARSSYQAAVSAFPWAELPEFWSMILDAHPPEKYSARGTLNVSLESWMPIEFLALVRETTCREDGKHKNVHCDPYFDTLVLNLLFA